MKSVVFTTDVFRGQEFGLRGVAENAHWLRGLLHGAFSMTGFTQHLFTSQCDNGTFDVAGYRQRSRLPDSEQGWARTVNTKIATRDESYFTQLLSAELVIGWGLTPALLDLLDRHRIPFVDVEVDSLRFSDDLMIRARTNHPGLSRFFAARQVPESNFTSSVAELRAFVGRRDGAAVEDGPCMGLFAGQCRIDLSLVEDGRIVIPADRLKQIRAVADQVDLLLIKPHPLEREARHLTALLDAIPNARMTRSNIYRILSDVKLERVVALSSSVLDEAAVFGVATVRLARPDRDGSALVPRSTSRWYRLATEEIADPGFVNAFLGIAAPPSGRSRRRLDLRRSLNTAWGFRQVYDQPDLTLRVEPRTEPKLALTYRAARRALRSIL
jgi:hypothetical protein